ncbi:MAG: hypothetical protein J2P25_20130 [Nocardiopsaceae bacterium]|nr:hypothetical protein [Nocardiopsaceae bacterium]
MSPDFDVGAGVAAAVRDRAGAWRFIADFAGAWLSPLTDGDGYSDSDIAAAEERLSVKLPVAVREAYRLFGRREDLTSEQDDLLRPGEWRLEDDGRVLVFRVENQGCARWGVRLDHPGQEDPPVVMRVDVAGQRTGWMPYLDRFSLACLEIALSEAVIGAEPELGLDDNGPLDDEAAVTALERNFTRLAIPAYPMWAMAGQSNPDVRWFAGPDVILRCDGDEWVWARARTRAALAPVRKALPVDWLMLP